MKALIIATLIMVFAALAYAQYPFDLGLHMGMSTGGSGGSFPANDAILWDASGDAIYWDASTDAIFWE